MAAYSLGLQSMERQGTHSGSSETLVRGLELANQPLGALLNLHAVKDEPADEEELNMMAEIQARLMRIPCACTCNMR